MSDKRSRGTCPTCGEDRWEYRQTMGLGNARMLAKVAIVAGCAPVDLRDARLGLTHVELCTFSKLKYWGFAEKADHSSPKGGIWALTQRGIDFWKGAIRVPYAVWTFDDAVVEVEPKEIAFNECRVEVKYRADYVRERRPHRDDAQQQELL